MADKALKVFVESGGIMDKIKAALSPAMIPLAKKTFRRESARFMARVRDQARAHAPINKGPTRATKRATKPGNLKRAIKSKGTQGGGAKLYVDKSGGSSGLGFHWHLVERGTTARKTKKGASRGTMPAAPFLNAVIDEAAARAEHDLIQTTVAAVREQFTKAGAK
jgi:HK97 gp10 family phage protein